MPAATRRGLAPGWTGGVPVKTQCETCKAKCAHAGKPNKFLPMGGKSICRSYRETEAKPNTPYTTDKFDLSWAFN